MNPADLYAARCDHMARRRTDRRRDVRALLGAALVLLAWALVVAVPVMVWIYR